MGYGNRTAMRFLFVHGGAMGAWCWDHLSAALNTLGYETISIDLPGHGGRRDEIASLDGYRDAVLEALRPGDVLVGHTMGGYVATLAAGSTQRMRQPASHRISRNM